MIFTFITCPSNIYIILRNYFALVMYISVGGWTCNTTMHAAAATLGYITNKPLKPTHLLKSFAKKKHCIKIVYARIYDHNVCIKDG